MKFEKCQLKEHKTVSKHVQKKWGRLPLENIKFTVEAGDGIDFNDYDFAENLLGNGLLMTEFVCLENKSRLPLEPREQEKTLRNIKTFDLMTNCNSLASFFSLCYS